MLPKRKIGFGYIVGKLITCSTWNRCHYFSKEVRKVFIRSGSKVPSIWKINIKMLIEKHVRMFLTSDDFFFSNHMSNILYKCLEQFELVLID